MATNIEVVLQTGAPGAAGVSPTVAVGTTTTGVAGTAAKVTNSGTANAAVFDFVIPQGSGNIAPDWAVNTVYVLNQTCVYNGIFYRCTTAHTSETLFEPSYFEAIPKSDALYNTKLGTASLYSITTGNYNDSFGYHSLYSNTTGTENTSVGNYSLSANISGSNNTAVGAMALASNTAGCNCALGFKAGYYNTTGTYNTFLGHQAGYDSSVSAYTNVTCLGSGSTVTASNQVQLGDSSTTTYYYSLASRSDQRDKTDIANDTLGLEFIKKLTPRTFRWNYREDYKEYTTSEVETTDSEGNTITEQQTTVTELDNDGSKARTRYHHGLIAQEVKTVMDDLGIDFAGYQDHSRCGGEDVLSVNYMELIGPMIKAIQELSAEVKALKGE